MEKHEHTQERVVEQRIRNRMIDYFDFASDIDGLKQFEASQPHINVVNEVFNQWDDWASPSNTFPEGVYSPEERDTVAAFKTSWEQAARDVTATYPRLADVAGLDSWKALVRAAAASLDVFARRGKLSDDFVES